MPFEWLAFRGKPGYPTLQLHDAVGEVHEINPTQPGVFSAPTSTLVGQPGSIPARWTIGYQVPSATATDLDIVAVWEGQPVASWELTNYGDASYTGWSAPDATPTARFGDQLPWSTSLTVTPLAGDIHVCGDPETEYAVAVYGLAVDVENTTSTDALWPRVFFPEDTAIALWADGGSARTGGITVAETFVTEADNGETTDPLGRRTGAQVIIPPQTTATRMLGFALPRDDRFGSAFLSPQSVMLYPPLGSPIWLDVSGSGLVDFTLDESVCAEVEPSVAYTVAPPS